MERFTAASRVREKALVNGNVDEKESEKVDETGSETDSESQVKKNVGSLQQKEDY